MPTGNKLYIFICYLLFSVITFSFLSCSKDIKTEQELINHINNSEHGLKKEKKVNEVDVSCTYQPQGLIRNKIDSLSEKNLYFILQFSYENKELLKQLDYNLYSEMVQVLSFRMQQYVSLQVRGKDPIEPLDCLFQQTYGMGNANTLMVVFDRDAIRNNKNFVIRIKEFGLGIGNILFEYETNKLDAIDEIIL